MHCGVEARCTLCNTTASLLCTSCCKSFCNNCSDDIHSHPSIASHVHTAFRFYSCVGKYGPFSQYRGRRNGITAKQHLRIMLKTVWIVFAWKSYAEANIQEKVQQILKQQRQQRQQQQQQTRTT